MSSVFGNVATYYIGRWGALKGHEARQVGPSEAEYEGLNEILAEVDGERLEHDIVTDPRLLRRLEEDPAFKALWVEHWANKAVDATSDDPPALPWVEAYHYVGQMLEREKLTEEARFATALQLSNLLKRLRQRGTLEWTEVDKLPDEKVPKADVITQKKAAELCNVSVRTIKNLENIYEKTEPPTRRTLQKIYGGLQRIAEEGVARWQDTALPTESYF